MKFLNFFKKIAKNQPLTSRGFILFALAILCLFYFGKESSDLVATIIGLTIAIVGLMTLLPLLFTSRFIFKKFKEFKDQTPHSDQKHFAAKEFASRLNLPPFKIPPFFTLSLSRVFPDEYTGLINKKTLKLFGNFNAPGNKFNVQDQLKFSHRGVFGQTGFRASYGDILGLTRLEKFISAPKNYTIHPQEVQIEPIAIMAASAQLGDVEHSNLERTGDLFDIRAYQPGDSLKRVLWKVYARSGNVVVRQPEPAIVPEGEVAIFVAARDIDDQVAASALSYLKLLEEQNIIFSLSAFGHYEGLAATIEESEKLLIESANKAALDQGESFKIFLKKLKEKNFSAKKIILFTPGNLSADDFKFQNEAKLLREIGVQANQFGVELAVAIVPKKLTFVEIQANYVAKEILQNASLKRSWLDKFNEIIEKISFKKNRSRFSLLRFGNKDNKQRTENVQTIFYDKEVIQVKYNDV